MTIQNQQQYKFFYGTKKQLDRLIGLGLVNQNHLYYLTDKQQIYVGDKLYGSEFKVVDEFPPEPKINTLYIHKDTKEIRIFENNEYKVICLPVSQNLDVDYSLATSKAIREYIKNISDKNITGIEYRVENQSLNVLYGDGSTKNILLKEIITGVNYDSQTGNFEFSRANGKGIIINTPKENFLSDVKYDPHKNTITFTMVNGATFNVDLTDLIEIYTTEDTQSIDMNLSGNRIFANLKLSNKEDNRAKLDENGLYVPDTDLSNYSTSNEIISKIDEVFTPLQQEVDRLEIDKQNNLTAGLGIRIDNNVISSMFSSVEWGNIQGNILDQKDLQEQFSDLKNEIQSDMSNYQSELQGQIDTLSQQTTQNIQDVQNNLDTAESNLDKKISDLDDNTQSKIEQLNTTIDTTKQELSQEISATKTEVENTIQPKLDELDQQLDTKQNVLTSENAGDGISIVDGVISNTRVSAEWGGISGVLSNQSDLQSALNSKANASDLTNKANASDIKNGKLTIQANGATIATFTANQSTDATANIQIPDSATWGKIAGTLSNQTDLQNALNGKLSTTGTADKALKDKNGKQIDTTYMYKTIGSQVIPITPTGITRLEMVGKQGGGNGVISGGTLVSLHSNTAYKCYERKGATITCNYDDKVSNLGKSMCDGSYSGHYTAINPRTMFANKPFVWEVVSPSQFEVSDVLRLHLYGHRLVDQVNCTAFKIDAYIQNTLTNAKEWVEVYNYSGTSVNIAQTGWGLYITGYSTNPYYPIFGVRLTISGASDTVFRLSEIQLVASRGTEKVCDAIQCLSTDGGKVWGNLEVTGNITSSNTYTKTEINSKIANKPDKSTTLSGYGITNAYTKTEVDELLKDVGGGGLEVCDIGMALYVDETKGLRRYLNGQIVERNDNTEAFFTRLQEITTLHPSLLCTEDEWQTAKTMSAFGQVGKFVFNYDDISTYVVIKPLVNSYIKITPIDALDTLQVLPSGSMYCGTPTLSSDGTHIKVSIYRDIPFTISATGYKTTTITAVADDNNQFIGTVELEKDETNGGTESGGTESGGDNTEITGEQVIVSVRIPRVVNIQGLFDLQNLGLTVGAGLPNITGDTYDSNNSGYSLQVCGNNNVRAKGAFKFSESKGASISEAANWQWGQNADLSFDASRSNSIYGNSTTVQPEAIQYPYFIQIATGAETENNIINDIELNNPYSLFDSKYSDYKLNNLSWLRSEGQWNPKAVYPTAYDELLKEYNNPDRLATFNKDAFEVVGSPTITSDGVASGFSRSNSFIQIPFTFNTTSTYKIQLMAQTPSNPIINGFLLGGAGQFFEIYCNDNNFALIYRDNSNNPRNVGWYSFQPNTKYHMYCEFNLSTLNIAFGMKKDGDTDYQIYSTVMSSYSTPITSTHLGNTDNQYSIDLKQFSITVDGQRVFSGAKSKVKLSTEEYTDYDFVLNTADETFRLPLLDGSEDLPSNRYTDLELLSSGSSYTAPANGWFCIYSSSITNTILARNGNNVYGSTVIGASGYVNLNTLQIKKGESITATYGTASGTSIEFIYAQGNGSLYYYVGETVQNANLIDAGRIGEQLPNKVDMSNTQWAINACMPDYSAGVSIALDTTYTCPKAGFVLIHDARVYGGTCTFTLNGTSYNIAISGGNYYDTGFSIVPVAMNDTVKLNSGTIKFYPAKGAN